MNSSTDVDANSSTRRTRRQESSESEGDYAELCVVVSVHSSPGEGFSTGCTTCTIPDPVQSLESSDSESDYVQFCPALCSEHSSTREGFSTGCTTCLSPDPKLLIHWLSIDFKKVHAFLNIRLMVAVNFKREDVVKWLLQIKRVNPNYNIRWRSPIGCAVRMGYLGIVKLLLEAGANVETVDYSDGNLSGYNPVHVAACNGSLKLLQLLVRHGANINKRNGNHCTALHLATLHGHSHLVKWLLSAGAIVNVLQDNGMSALHTASSLGHTDICRLLIEAGAYPLFCTIDGWTALHTAVAYGHEAIVKLLLEAGADISSRILATGDTLLHTACTIGSVAIVRLLLRAGVPIESKNVKGNTPLLTCVENCDVFTSFFLLKLGANATAVNNEGTNGLGLLINCETTPSSRKIPIAQKGQLKYNLLQAGGRLNSENRMKDVRLELNDVPIENLLSLQDMCHVVVRQTLAPDLQMKVFKLPLPSAIKRVMALDDMQIYLSHPEHGVLAANINADDVDVIVYSRKGLAFELTDNIVDDDSD